jgi:hypothetical protein
MNVLRNIQIVHVAPDATAATTFTLAAGTTDVNSAAVDTQGFMSATFFVTFGDNADTATFTGKIQGSADGSTGWTDLPGATTSFTAGATDTDNEMIAVAVFSPAFRYLRFVSDRGVANTAINAIHALLTVNAQGAVTQSTAAGQFIQAPVFVSFV